MQYIFSIIFVLDPDGTGSIGSCHLTFEYCILLIECAHVIDLYGHAGLHVCYMYMTGDRED